MSGFTALNVEPEDTVEEEVDDTKEIQLEEAFKLYQNALRLQSLGSDFYEEAAAAYQELFQSEVFKYVDALSDFAHDEVDEAPGATVPQAETESLTLLPSNANESTANSVPQLVYLSYKSRGQFLLDQARSRIGNAPKSRHEVCQYYAEPCQESLKDFAQALERDDTDLDLWKKAARVADILSKQRLSRFCQESVLAGDDEDSDLTIDLSGLDEAFAIGELDAVLQVLQDDLSRSRGNKSRPRSRLMQSLKLSNDPYRFLPRRAAHLEYVEDNMRPISFSVGKNTLLPTRRSWESFGQCILAELTRQQEDPDKLEFNAIYTIAVPSESSRLDGQTALKENGKILNVQSDLKLGNVQNVEERSGSDARDMSAGAVDNEEVAVASPKKSSPEAVTDLNHAPPEAIVANGHREENDADDEEVMADASTSTMTLPTRKRSSTVAGNDEPEARTKSRRIRARESVADLATQEEESQHDLGHYYHNQLEIHESADRRMFKIANEMLSKAGVKELGSLDRLQQDFWQLPDVDDASNGGQNDWTAHALADLNAALMSWNDEKSQATLHGHGSQDFVEKSAGLTLFLQHTKGSLPKDVEYHEDSDEADLASFVDNLNVAALTVNEIAFQWLMSLMVQSPRGPQEKAASYIRERWPPPMKKCVVQVLLTSDEYIHGRLQSRLCSVEDKTLNLDCSEADLLPPLSEPWYELAQAIFELHLDVYSEITNPSSQVELTTRFQQKDRLERWARLNSAWINLRHASNSTSESSDPLVMRFLWASATFAKLDQEAEKSHVLLCLQDLRSLLASAASPIINLPNNAAMPQISIAAVDQETSRLSTLDFFMSVFETDNSDPVAVIMKLEPILEPETVTDSAEGIHDNDGLDQVAKLTDFLESGDASLKLFLWRRLQNAYTAISYQPKVVSCLLRSVETIVQEISSSRHIKNEEDSRQVSMLRWLRDADELIAKALPKLINEANAYACIDESHLRSSIVAISSLLRLLHGFALFDDSVRVGQSSAPALKSASLARSYEKCKDRFREFQVRLWTCLYTLLKESTVQSPEMIENSIGHLTEYLVSVHDALGLRQYCKYSNKVFVRLVKTELLATEAEADYSHDIAQVLFDLHQLKFVAGLGDANHGCVPETLDKKTAAQLVPTIMKYACRLNVRDLIKSELKGTIDKIQQALGQVKSSPPLLYNKKLISAFLKTPISSTELYRCIKGHGDLPTKPVSFDSAMIGRTGWYFMLGHTALAKYRSVKRVNPTPTDDLDVAAAFLRQDLEHDTEKWESWYRLAQVFDAKIEDDLIWNSTKLNESRGDIAALERSAIHAYTMSIAIAMRTEDDSMETAEKIGDMFGDFASRLYSSSRPPLNMEVFNTEKYLRHLSNSTDGTMSKVPSFEIMKPYALWKYAAYLLRKRFTGKAKLWLCYYVLGKCLWKMLQSVENASSPIPVTREAVLEAFTEAIYALPKREKSHEYILEPHFKLVSTVHKLVQRRAISPTEGVDFLQPTQFSHNVHLSEDENGQPEWEPYVLRILKKLGSADKSNWHHRIIARAAHVIYDDQRNVAGALGAKHEFTQQIFTKTMTLQVWKPEFERPGRHYVYTGRYVLFFVHLLDRLNDRSNLDQLLRRIRRKSTDFLDHSQIWEEAATTYVRMLRRAGRIPEGRERTLFDTLSYEEFSNRSEKLERWAHDPDTTSISVDIMRDAIDLKKLNNSLMKGPAIDDLIGDTYACIYEAYVSQMTPEKTVQPEVPSVQNTFINLTTEAAPTGNDTHDRMRLNNLLSGQADGAQDNPVPGPATVSVGLGLHTPTHQFLGTPPPEAPRNPTPSKPGRTKTITRREIQRRAEAAIVKPPPIKTPVLGKKPIIEIPSSSRNGGYFGNVEAALDKNVAGLIKDDEGGDNSRVSSRRASAQNSADEDGGGEADDESELSDLDEDDEENAERKLLFPGLTGRRTGDLEGHDEDAGIEEDDGDGGQQDVDESDAGDGVDEDEQAEVANSQEAIDGVDGSGGGSIEEQ